MKITALVVVLVAMATMSSASTNMYFGLNGYPDRMQMTNTPALSPSSNVTVEAWVRPTSRERWHVVCVNRINESTFPHNSYYLGSSSWGVSNRWRFGVTTVDNTGSQTTVNDNQPINTQTWTHLAGTYDGSTVRLYVNGSLTAETNCTGEIIYSDYYFKIGHATGLEQSMKGDIEDVRIWERALSECEIASRMHSRPTGAEEGLVAYYTFDSGAGTDSTTNKNDLTVYGGSFVSDLHETSNSIYRAIEVPFMSGSPLVQYRLQYTTNLLSTNWVNAGQSISGNGQEQSLFDGPRDNSPRFYRVISTY